MKWFGRLFIILIIIGGLGYIFREQLILKLIHYKSRQSTPVGPHREVVWDKAPADVRRDADRRPSIILIVADDLGWNDITLNGGVAKGSVPTPNIDSIAKKGVQFTNGYAANATCSPSRAALLSGRYPTRYGFEFTPTPGKFLKMISKEPPKGLPPQVTHFDDPDKKQRPFDEMGLTTEEITIAEMLKAQGYYTAHIGKWHLGRENGMAPNQQGVDDSLMMHSGLYLAEDDPNAVNAKQDFNPIDPFIWASFQHASSFNSSAAFKPRGYITDYFTEEAVKVIEANKNRPFFLYLDHFAPHIPLQVTKADYDALSNIKDHDLRVYAAMIRALDRGVGQVMDALKESGIDDKTLVVFTSDNGGTDYIGLPDINQPFRGWKLTFFEGRADGTGMARPGGDSKTCG